jgi:hypothetical protein
MDFWQCRYGDRISSFLNAFSNPTVVYVVYLDSHHINFVAIRDLGAIFSPKNASRKRLSCVWLDIY